ncbi:MAG: UDP-N-acetylmuramoyl-L-alanyl-D-glutamate--2,6-diaminopimelate ligase [Candidatus Omnitrophota bacterium]
MTIKQIFPDLNITPEIRAINANDISDNSRLVKKGDVFFIKPGSAFDVFSVLKKIEAKVALFVADKKDFKRIRQCNLSKPVVFVKDMNERFYKAVDLFYGIDNKNLKVIGITGTKGKTTTAFLIQHLLIGLKQKASLIGTIKCIIGKKTFQATHTTPDFLSLRKIFSEIKETGKGYVVMEVSSHAIDQDRIRGIDFSRCVFTNLSREHLDYHKNMRNYFLTKKSFFLKNANAVSIINQDDDCAAQLMKGVKKIITYGIKSNADFKACDLVVDKNGIKFGLFYKEKYYKVECGLLGKHNIYNVLSAIATIFSLGFSLNDIINIIKNFKGVEGRLQEVRKGIFIDYAHSPDSLEKALETLRDIGYAKTVCVFGCGGNRDKGKRKVMGHIASRLADFTVITSDNPRNEDPYDICRQIESGFNNKNYLLIPDRKKAIAKALRLKGKSDKVCLLVAGKGHENYQIIGDEKISFKDSKVVEGLLSK